MGFAEYPIENAGVAPARSRADRRIGIFGAEQRIKDGARVDFGRAGRRGRSPGDVIAVYATVAGVANPHHPPVFAGELERRNAGARTDLLGRDLVHGNARGDIGTASFKNVNTGQISGSGAGMIARAVSIGPAEMLRQTLDHQHLLALRLHRLENARQERNPLPERTAANPASRCRSAHSSPTCGRAAWRAIVRRPVSWHRAAEGPGKRPARGWLRGARDAYSFSPPNLRNSGLSTIPTIRSVKA